MFTMMSLIGAWIWTILLIGLIWINFKWHHQYDKTPLMWWFHIGSLFMALFFMGNIILISIINLPLSSTYDFLRSLSLGLAILAYGRVGILLWLKKWQSDHIKKASIPLDKVFQSFEDQVLIYDSNHQLVASNDGLMGETLSTSVGNLKGFLELFYSEISVNEKEGLETFFNKRTSHMKMLHYRLMIQSHKSYMILSKVIDQDKDWVGTVLLVHQAEDEIELIQSIKKQNAQRQVLNEELHQSLANLEKLGYEKEKEALLKEINHIIITNIKQSIQEIQSIERMTDPNSKEAKMAIETMSQDLGNLYKELRQLVKKMSLQERGSHHD